MISNKGAILIAGHPKQLLPNQVALMKTRIRFFQLSWFYEVLPHLFQYIGNWQRHAADLASSYLQGLWIMKNGTWPDTQLLINYANIVVAVGYPKTQRTEFLLPYIQSFYKASKALLKSTLLKIIHTYHKVSISCFHTLSLVKLFNKLNIAGIHLLTLRLTTKTVIKTSNEAHRTKHPPKIIEIELPILWPFILSILARRLFFLAIWVELIYPLFLL